jgi:hypothetical protein
MPSSSEKWKISLFSALIFLLVVNPYTYKITQNIFGDTLKIGTVAVNGCPTTYGIFLHTVVYVLLVRYSMDMNFI